LDDPAAAAKRALAAGVGFAEKLFAIRGDLFGACLELVKDCPCESGCPSCVGPAGELGPSGKEGARRLLEFLAAN